MANMCFFFPKSHFSFKKRLFYLPYLKRIEVRQEFLETFFLYNNAGQFRVGKERRSDQLADILDPYKKKIQNI